MRNRSGILMGGLSLLLAVTALAAPRAAEAQADDRWLPWLGCWVPLEVYDETAPMTCVRPAVAGGVELLTVASDRVVESRTLRADGIDRPSEAGECSGVERSEFSRDGARVFLVAERSCPGSIGRHVTGLLAMVDQDRWVHAQSMELGGRSAAWVRVYRPAPRSLVEAAGLAELLDIVDRQRGAVDLARAMASAPISVEEIIEAHARTDAEAVKAWLAEQRHPIELDARRLVQLADAGVPGEVIDVAVAVAYPEHFALDRDDRVDAIPSRAGYATVYPLYWDPFYGSYYHGFNRYGYGWGVGYGYPYGGYWGPTRVIVVRPRESATPLLRAVRGRGYTDGSSSAGSQTASQPQVRAHPSSSSPRPATSRPTRRTNDTPPRTAKPRGGGDDG